MARMEFTLRCWGEVTMSLSCCRGPVLQHCCWLSPVSQLLHVSRLRMLCTPQPAMHLQGSLCAA